MKENIAVIIDNSALEQEDQEIVDLKELTLILDKYTGARGGLIAILEEIQKQYGYLPEKALRLVAEKTGKSLVDVYSVGTFYSSLSLKPRGKHIVCACLGTACHVRGAPRVVDEFERQLGINPGETTADKQFTLETVNCLGACALGPVVVIDGQYFSKVKKNGVRELLDDSLTGFANRGGQDNKRTFPLEVSCPRCNHSLMDASRTLDGHPTIRITLASGHQHGRLRLSSVYGSSNMLIEHDISPGKIPNFLCPHCHRRLASHENCFECGAPMAAMIINGGGLLKVCTRLGCKGHMLDLV